MTDAPASNAPPHPAIIATKPKRPRSKAQPAERNYERPNVARHAAQGIEPQDDFNRT